MDTQRHRPRDGLVGIPGGHGKNSNLLGRWLFPKTVLPQDPASALEAFKDYGKIIAIWQWLLPSLVTSSLSLPPLPALPSTQEFPGTNHPSSLCVRKSVIITCIISEAQD